jgi:hypothetical protein
MLEYVYYVLFHGVNINQFSLHESLNFTYLLVSHNYKVCVIVIRI